VKQEVQAATGTPAAGHHDFVELHQVAVTPSHVASAPEPGHGAGKIRGGSEKLPNSKKKNCNLPVFLEGHSNASNRSDFDAIVSAMEINTI
jgi:hypothetical protein